MKNSTKTILAAMIGVFALQANAMQFNEEKVMAAYKQQDRCLFEVEKKMNVPANILSSMVIGYSGYEDGEIFKFHKIPAQLVAKEMNVSIEKLTTDKCVSYAAMATWLMEHAGGDNGDIWKGVDRFYYGDMKSNRKHYATENAKQVYDIISRSSKK